MINTVPEQLRDYIELKEDKIVFKREIPIELKSEFEEFKRTYEVSNAMNKYINEYEPKELTELDIEFEKYCKLYEEKFGKIAYISEPNGTKKFAIEFIKKCLDENKDILDDLYYPNLNNDKFVWKNGDIKIAKTQCELCKHNDKEYPNVCSQYPSEKPNEVISNSIRCPKFDNENKIEL